MAAKRAAGCVIYRRIYSQIEYLLLRATYGSFHWSPPKGHVDPGEDDYVTALRETQEETGYTADDLIVCKDAQLTLNYKVGNSPKTVIYWLAELRDHRKEPVLSTEHSEYKWLAKDAAIELVGFRDTQELLKKFHAIVLERDDNCCEKCTS